MVSLLRRIDDRVILAVILISLVWCQALDGLITMYGIRLGIARELNPIMAGWIDTWWGVGFKVLVAIGLSVFIWLRAAPNLQFAIRGTRVLALGSALIVAWNLAGCYLAVNAVNAGQQL